MPNNNNKDIKRGFIYLIKTKQPKTMTTYSTINSIRLTNSRFTTYRIPDANITQFIAAAKKNVNSILNITTDLTVTQLGECNADVVSDLMCAIACCNYDPEKVFYKDLEEADKQTRRFHEMLHDAKEILRKYKVTAVAPSEAGFTLMTNS